MAANPHKTTIRPDYKPIPQKKSPKNRNPVGLLIIGIGMIMSVIGIFGYQSWRGVRQTEAINTITPQSLNNSLPIDDNKQIKSIDKVVNNTNNDKTVEKTNKPNKTSNQNKINQEDINTSKTKPSPNAETTDPLKTSFDFYNVLPHMKVGEAPELANSVKPAVKDTTKPTIPAINNIAKPTINIKDPIKLNNLPEKEPVKTTTEPVKTIANAAKDQLAVIKPVQPINSVTSNIIYMLQAGAFNDPEAAKKLRANLAFSGLESNTQTIINNGKEWYRVRVGPFHDIQQAIAAKNRLSQKGITAILSQERRN